MTASGRGRRAALVILFGAMILAGAGLLLYPTLSELRTARRASAEIGGYEDEVESLRAQELAAIRAEAERYNETLPDDEHRFELSQAEYARYTRLLDLSGSGIMGVVSIPSIDVRLPIYHGTEASALQTGVGHLAGSSLPVGGESTHAVISGHTGLPSARLFDRLTELETGDTFSLTVLDETLTYEVEAIRVVLPEELDALAIEEGADLCTLVTCTPYGVNTHRLLVRGRRVLSGGPAPAPAVESAESAPTASPSWTRLVKLSPPIAAMAVALIAVVPAAGRYRRERERTDA